MTVLTVKSFNNIISTFDWYLIYIKKYVRSRSTGDLPSAHCITELKKHIISIQLKIFKLVQSYCFVNTLKPSKKLNTSVSRFLKDRWSIAQPIKAILKTQVVGSYDYFVKEIKHYEINFDRKYSIYINCLNCITEYP